MILSLLDIIISVCYIPVIVVDSLKVNKITKHNIHIWEKKMRMICTELAWFAGLVVDGWIGSFVVDLFCLFTHSDFHSDDCFFVSANHFTALFQIFINFFCNRKYVGSKIQYLIRFIFIAFEQIWTNIRYAIWYTMHKSRRRVHWRH